MGCSFLEWLLTFPFGDGRLVLTKVSEAFLFYYPLDMRTAILRSFHKIFVLHLTATGTAEYEDKNKKLSCHFWHGKMWTLAWENVDA